MAALTTMFLYVTALDALLSIGDAALYAIVGVPAYAATSVLLLFILLPWSALMLALTAFSPRLPKRVLLPLVALLGWQLLGAMPLPLLVSPAAATAIANCAGLVCVAIALRWIASGSGSYQVTEAWLESRGPAFRWAHLIGWGSAFALLVPSLLTGYALLSAKATLDHFTGDFMRLGLDGLYSVEREYERGDQHVHLIGMVHIGESSFYSELIDSLPVEGTIVLAEGVSDESGLLKDLRYERVAASVGLAQQGSFEVEQGPAVVRADVEAAEFSKSTLRLLSALGRILSAESGVDRLRGITDYGELAQDPEAVDALLYDVLDRRNARVLSEFDRVAGEYSRIVIPWGAIHMRELEPAIVERGFERTGERERRAIAFGGP